MLLASAVTVDELEHMLARRLAGEPVEWVAGWTDFCGVRVALDPGVYVPRPQTEALAEAAAARLPADGVALDLGTGSGAVAMVLAAQRPAAVVLATELSPVAVSCARRNGVDVLEGDLYAPLPTRWSGRIDVIVANVPYVPTGAIALLPREARDHEPLMALDGGRDGLDLARAVVRGAPSWLAPGGWLLVEAGVDQSHLLAGELEGGPWSSARVLTDAEGDGRGVEAQLS